MNQQIIGRFKWIPRILAILYICFISLFALDAFSGEESFLEQIAGFIIHLIPSLVLILVLLIAWKKERMGGLLFILLSLAFTLFFNTYRNWVAFLFISVPVLAVGVLFTVSPGGKVTPEKAGEEVINKDLSG
ncbi:MAG: hypothetical protein APR63_04480 [Desulfuromonas sp. SDB]|nr:MAG: hypothetical protein APR63_04480 [Desulfuromonas sp. SDB]